MKTYDVAVIGAGVFGSWSAYWLRRNGWRVILVDAYGAANSRASSGGESRIIRMAYGADEIYTRWSMRSLEMWREMLDRVRQPLFYQTGVLWTAGRRDPNPLAAAETFRRLGVLFETLDSPDLKKRYRQISFTPGAWGLFEPESGALMARRAVHAVVGQSVRDGVEYRVAAVAPPRDGGSLADVCVSGPERIRAGAFVFACGPWLPKLFPRVLKGRIRPTRQEVFFFGAPPGDARFAPPSMPVWIDFAERYYCVPDIEQRGFKAASDHHGPRWDPDTGRRVVSPRAMIDIRRYIARRLPALKNAPIVETRVCQYENTSSGDFLIDRHPAFDNVWLVGGGSGHGFKHGPAVGEHVSALLDGSPTAEPRFSLATKQRTNRKSVF